jgi:hypothetical protein
VMGAPSWVIYGVIFVMGDRTVSAPTRPMEGS